MQEIPGVEYFSMCNMHHPVTSSSTFVLLLSACDDRAFDVVFLLDSSGSVGEQNFTTMKEFVKEVIQKLPIGPDATNVGLITFSKYPVVRITLSDFDTKADLLNAVDSVQYVAGKTLHKVITLL